MQGPCDPDTRHEIDPGAGYERPEHDRSPIFSRRRFLTTSGLAIAGATLYACTGGAGEGPSSGGSPSAP